MLFDSSHVTRLSDSSINDEVCVNCGAGDKMGVPGGPQRSGLLQPCPKPPSKGGMTYEEYLEKDRERMSRVEKRMRMTK